MNAGWIKVCGMTTPEAVTAALAARVDAIGFVFAPSVRRVDPRRARELAAPARGRVLCVAVTQHPAADLLDDILGVFDPDLLQTDAEDLAALARVPAARQLPVLRPGHALPASLPARVVFEGPRSGAGVPTDWQQAALLAESTRLVLAGGLDAANVREAIRRVRPFGVDVSSGVELSAGLKCPRRIQDFVAAARAAFAEQEPA